LPNEREHNSFTQPEQWPEQIIICNGTIQLSSVTANLKDFTYKQNAYETGVLNPRAKLLGSHKPNMFTLYAR
jgi:hypothetical protein